jgi:hypothetical protein
MYTATVDANAIDRASNQRIITVSFTNGTVSFQHTFRFGLDITLDVIKRTIKQFADRLAAAEADTSVTPGALDLSDVADPTPTVDQLARDDWFSDWRDLQWAKTLRDHGVEILTAIQYTALQNKVRTGFRAEYIR